MKACNTRCIARILLPFFCRWEIPLRPNPAANDDSSVGLPTHQNVPDYPLKPSGALVVRVGRHGIADASIRVRERSNTPVASGGMPFSHSISKGKAAHIGVFFPYSFSVERVSVGIIISEFILLLAR